MLSSRNLSATPRGRPNLLSTLDADGHFCLGTPKNSQLQTNGNCAVMDSSDTQDDVL